MTGEPLNPSVVTHNFHKLAASAGLSGVRLHDLIHTFAMLLRSAKPEVISEALGHTSIAFTSIAFTMDVYSHIIEGMQSDVISLLDEVLPPGKNGVKNNINAKLTPAVDITLSVN
ncbi:hypothetical protein ACFLUR_03760 [Chloroflexota bacterium]